MLDLGKEPSLATDDRITASPVAAPTPTPIAEWHVIHAGQEVGPLSLAALVEKAVVGDVEADDLVKQTGGLWTKASDFRFLRDARTDGDRQRRQPFPVKDYREEARQRTPEKASQRTKAMVSPAAWVMFALGGILFLLDGFSILRVLVWFVIFGAPVCLCLRYKKRRGVTFVATLFCLAAGLDAGVAVYSRCVLQPRIDETLSGSIPKAVNPSLTTRQYDQRLNSTQPPAAPRYDPDLANAKVGQPRYDPDLAPAAERPSKDAVFYFHRGKDWMEKKEYDKAIEDFSESIRLDPANAESHMFRGMTWSCKKDYDKAQKDFDEAHRLDPKFFPSRSK